MAANGTMGLLEFYNNAFQSWSDSIGSWTKTAEEISEGLKGNESSFKWWGSWPQMMETNNGFKWWGSWGHAGKIFTEMMETLPLPYEPMKNMNESLRENIRVYRTIYENCIKNMANIAKEGYSLDVKIIAGEEPEADAFFEAIHCAYDDIACTMADGLKESPFKGIKDINEAIKKSLKSFSDERNTAKSVFKEMMNFNAKMAKI
jgi:hypothetical protein